MIYAAPNPNFLSLDQVIQKYKKQDTISKLVLAFGNESRGVSKLLMKECDEGFVLPMRGFTSSYNISVSVALALQTLECYGILKQGELTLDEREKLLEQWLMKVFPLAKYMLKRKGIEPPPDY